MHIAWSIHVSIHITSIVSHLEIPSNLNINIHCARVHCGGMEIKLSQRMDHTMNSIYEQFIPGNEQNSIV